VPIIETGTVTPRARWWTNQGEIVVFAGAPSLCTAPKNEIKVPSEEIDGAEALIVEGEPSLAFETREVVPAALSLR
jgi:hypothetical protein